jgi:hypothetical protein
LQSFGHVSVAQEVNLATYERLDPSVRSSVDLEMGLLVEALVAVGHAALVPFSWLWARLGLLMLPVMSVVRFLESLCLRTLTGSGRWTVAGCLAWIVRMRVSTSVEKLMRLPSPGSEFDRLCSPE